MGKFAHVWLVAYANIIDLRVTMSNVLLNILDHKDRYIYMAEGQLVHNHGELEEEEIDPLSDPDERRVLYAALDAFR